MSLVHPRNPSPLDFSTDKQTDRQNSHHYTAVKIIAIDII